jgi:YD repeat-containing protein
VVDASTGERFVGFAFDEAGRLNTVRRPHKTDEAYRYDGASARIATIARDGEVVLALTYDDEGRVIREQDALGLLDGAAVMYDYEPLPSGWVRTTVTYPESLVERGWHPTERAVHDDEARLREMVFQRTSGERLVGRYDYDSENRRIVIEDPCESLRPVPEMSPLWRLWFVLLSILVWLFG